MAGTAKKSHGRAHMRGERRRLGFAAIGWDGTATAWNNGGQHSNGAAAKGMARPRESATLCRKATAYQWNATATHGLDMSSIVSQQRRNPTNAPMCQSEAIGSPAKHRHSKGQLGYAMYRNSKGQHGPSMRSGKGWRSEVRGGKPRTGTPTPRQTKERHPNESANQAPVRLGGGRANLRSPEQSDGFASNGSAAKRQGQPRYAPHRIATAQHRKDMASQRSALKRQGREWPDTAREK